MIVLDTHVLIWWANGELKKLSRKARQAIELNSKRSELMVSAVSVFEIATLERRGRLRFKIAASEWLAQLRRLPEYQIAPLTGDIAERAGQFGENFPGDPADRMIAATAVLIGAPLVTYDEKLSGISGLNTIW